MVSRLRCAELVWIVVQLDTLASVTAATDGAVAER